MQFVFCILFLYSLIPLCFNKFVVIYHFKYTRYPSRGQTPTIMYFISSLLLLRFFPSDLPVILIILREDKSQKVSQKGPEKKMNKCGTLGLTAWRTLRRFVVIFIWNYHYSTQLNRTKGRN